MRQLSKCCLSLVGFLLLAAQVLAATNLPLKSLKMPPGFEIKVVAEVPSARSLTQGKDGVIFVGNRVGNKIYVVQNGKTKVFAEELSTPNGVAYKDGKLYVAEVSRILEFEADDLSKLPKKPVRVLAQKFPSDASHGWKFIRFGPDGSLYVPVGANCNICDAGTEYARIYKIDVNSSKKEVVAEGVRNTVGFDFHPQTQELWFTDNGRDWMGDDRPPCEINRLSKVNSHFGFPYCHGINVLDPEFGKGKKCSSYVPPEVELRAHVAPLGMRFYRGQSFPSLYQGSIIFAEHGSWNRSNPQGYRVAVAQVQNNKVVKVESLVEGFLKGESAWGRPVDIEELADGSILISDDKAGVLYQLSYKDKSKDKK